MVSKENIEKIKQANTLIFEVEQEIRKQGLENASQALYQARIEINNARSRGLVGPLTHIEDSFEDMTEWCKNNPGDIIFTCQYCGVYTAGKARCSDCNPDN